MVHPRPPLRDFEQTSLGERDGCFCRCARKSDSAKDAQRYQPCARHFCLRSVRKSDASASQGRRITVFPDRIEKTPMCALFIV